jgi:mRNA-degrading endonuclease RelE of RelBE toxin-antitoxin system
MNKFKIIWSLESKKDLNKIKNNISKSRLKNISVAPKQITYPEQYQIDEYRKDCRRIIIGNYKILYQFEKHIVFVIRVVNSLHDPIKNIN